MNASNYGYPPPSYTVPYSSTPSSIGPHRPPRFGYSGPTPYPRPRSSASKPNPDSYSDSMINNYGNSSFNSERADTFDNSYQTDSSVYYSANDTLYSNQSISDSSMLNRRCDMNSLRDSPLLYGERSLADKYPSPVYPKSPLLKLNFPHGGLLPSINRNGSAQNAAVNQKKQTFSARKFGKAKKEGMTSKGFWKCELCNIDFTSQIPYDMHLRGARHAKKLKAQQVTSSIQSQGIISSDGEITFFCSLCNVRANSSLQFQTHLEGSKHKNKLNPKEPKQPEVQAKKEDTMKNPTDVTMKEKANGSVSRPLPPDFGYSQPTKLTKFSCDICSITVNSDVQLQQHLSSKKHQCKVEGKPLVKGRKNKEENKSSDTSESSGISSKTSAKVVGVKTLASSFVQGETLQ